MAKRLLYCGKKTPLTSRNRWESKAHREPKKVYKKIYKKILKSSGQFAPHKFKKQKGNQPHLWLVFIIQKSNK